MADQDSDRPPPHRPQQDTIPDDAAPPVEPPRRAPPQRDGRKIPPSRRPPDETPPHVIDRARKPSHGTGWVQRGMRIGISDSCLLIDSPPIVAH